MNVSPKTSTLEDPEPEITFPASAFGKGIYFSVNKHIECRVHPNPILGRGLFATQDIPEGGLVWYVDKSELDVELISFEEMEEWKKKDPEKFDYHCKYAFQVDNNHLVGGDVEHDVSFFINHCCDPNVWLLKENCFVTRRYVRKGEELTYDYATSETAYLDFDNCVCLSPKCRGKVKKTDWMIPELQARYGRHFMPYILHALDAQRGVSA